MLEGHLGQRAYIYGQAPGIVEGAELRPWRGRAGQTLRRWLDLDEDEFYATFYCASVTRCYPGRSPSGSGDRVPTPLERELCSFWFEWELRLLRPELIVAVGGLADSPASAGTQPGRLHRHQPGARWGHCRPAPAPVGREPLAERAREPRPAGGCGRPDPRPSRSRKEARKRRLDSNSDGADSLPPNVRPAARLPEAVQALLDRLDRARLRVAGGADRTRLGGRRRDQQGDRPARPAATHRLRLDDRRPRRAQGRADGRAAADLRAPGAGRGAGHAQRALRPARP